MDRTIHVQESNSGHKKSILVKGKQFLPQEFNSILVIRVYFFWLILLYQFVALNPTINTNQATPEALAHRLQCHTAYNTSPPDFSKKRKVDNEGGKTGNKREKNESYIGH